MVERANESELAAAFRRAHDALAEAGQAMNLSDVEAGLVNVVALKVTQFLFDILEAPPRLHVAGLMLAAMATLSTALDELAKVTGNDAGGGMLQ